MQTFCVRLTALAASVALILGGGGVAGAAPAASSDGSVAAMTSASVQYGGNTKGFTIENGTHYRIVLANVENESRGWIENDPGNGAAIEPQGSMRLEVFTAAHDVFVYPLFNVLNDKGIVIAQSTFALAISAEGKMGAAGRTVWGFVRTEGRDAPSVSGYAKAGVFLQ